MNGFDPQDSAATLLRQRKAFADFGCSALQQTDLDKLLTEATRHCADGLGVRHAKVLAFRPEHSDLLVRAGVGWKPGVVGQATAPANDGDPSGRTLLQRKPVVIDDVAKPGEYTLPEIYPAHRIRSAVNVLILGSGAVPFGVLEVDAQETNRFVAADVDFLQAYANMISAAVINLERIDVLRESRDALSDLLREQQHRMRNNLQAIAAQLRLGAADAPAQARRSFETIERRIYGLAALYEHLMGTDLAKEVDLAAYIADLCRRMQAYFVAEAARIALVAQIDAGPARRVDIDTATALGTAVNELVANAIEHAFADGPGRIEVRLAATLDGAMLLQVADNGSGFGEIHGTSLGLTVVRRLVARAGAELVLDSAPGRTVWSIRLPPGQPAFASR